MCSYVERLVKCSKCYSTVRSMKEDWDYCQNRGSCGGERKRRTNTTTASPSMCMRDDKLHRPPKFSISTTTKHGKIINNVKWLPSWVSMERMPLHFNSGSLQPALPRSWTIRIIMPSFWMPARAVSGGDAYCNAFRLLRKILATTIPITVITSRPAKPTPTPIPILVAFAPTSSSVGVEDGVGVALAVMSAAAAEGVVVEMVVDVDVVDIVDDVFDEIDDVVVSGAFTVV
ncbi:hypothetical protein SCAR479_06536 [Seiridium cardinale]|uniref:Uncharacterized protein n=1 Tax=Seiridium cardinale TaxID=138064 RepID=A0ABR2XSM4_9PEZI